MKTIFSLLFILLLSGCGDKPITGTSITGTYENASIGRSFTFQKNGIVLANSNGKQIDQGPYTVNGDRIQVFNGPILKLMKDGSIDAGMGYGKLIKK